MRSLHCLFTVVILIFTATAAVAQPDDRNVFRCFPDGLASFPGDVRKFIDNHLKYPAMALRDEIEGRMLVEFTVTKNGELKNIHIIKGLTEDTNKEAVRMIDIMPCWIPASVDQEWKQPIVFRLP